MEEEDEFEIEHVEPYSCVFCSEIIEDENAAVTLTATWMPHWRDAKFSPLAQDFWCHSACLQKNWHGSWPWEPHVLYGVDSGDDRDYAESLALTVARPEDRADIEDMLGLAYEEGLHRSYGSDLVEEVLPLLTVLDPLLLTCGTFYVMADMDGQIAACGGFTRETPGSGEVIEGVAHIRHFATHPDFAGFGVGSRLFQHCLKEAKAAGLREFVCYSGLNAEGFYRTLGFKRENLIEIHMGEGAILPAVLLRRLI
ncbi:GNAT family N-acetyltransferase [Asticcacaulis sp. AND118]|uniref:GNAT family N-acetyltransferase n=1 Tax=Asticcacaulis sp. AND118 TaxID=2840468 RepID=UPI001CFFF92E|nr:GNAT family N-acetyltransferase [Asticcacaulis sp. AND118]UDF04680.1 GNAT family N-acetyltransferase [Asticcacaulis sp. AND118]